MSAPTRDQGVTCACGEVIALLAGAFAYTECPECPRAFYETGAPIPPEDVKAWREGSPGSETGHLACPW